jgi:hypothetical protein
VTLADGNLYLVTKKGNLILAAANAAGYQEKGRIEPLGENYTAATIADGRLYVRDEANIMCFDIRK